MTEETETHEEKSEAVKALPPFIGQMLTFIVAWAKQHPDQIIQWIMALLPGAADPAPVQSAADSFRAFPSQETLTNLAEKAAEAGASRQEIAQKLVREAK